MIYHKLSFKRNKNTNDDDDDDDEFDSWTIMRNSEL